MFTKLFNAIKKNDLLKILIVVVIGFVFFKFYYTEGLENVEAPKQEEVQLAQPAEPSTLASEPIMMPAEQQQLADVVAGSQQLTTQDLLPKYDEADEFVQQNPVAKLLKEQNFLISGYHAGVNTVVQSSKIPYHDLRSAPPIAKEVVSPFLNSSYEQPMGAGRREFNLA